MLLQIQLPEHRDGLAYHRQRWAEVVADPQFADVAETIETNVFGQIIMSPPPGGEHCRKQYIIARELEKRLGDVAFAECPVLTADGTKVMDAAWFSPSRYANVKGQQAFEIGPEICVEVLSPRNTDTEMRIKRELYFNAGAIECWTCDLDGKMTFCHRDSPDAPIASSQLCPDFPHTIPNP